jgi:hypothetical protein
LIKCIAYATHHREWNLVAIRTERGGRRIILEQQERRVLVAPELPRVALSRMPVG